ncbi:MAG: hypothetical protein RLZZ219_1773 [Cyanobacteriota bacterium]|jgi:hypothetical protein
MQASELDLAASTPVNHLWPELVERLGLERSARAARQALDLQAMRGLPTTVPLLLVETCGVGLVERARLRAATGLPVPEGDGVLLLFSRLQQSLQLLEVQPPQPADG